MTKSVIGSIIERIFYTGMLISGAVGAFAGFWAGWFVK